ncbi:MAG: PIN domain-containing protein [Deltaproteobacteria bacterium]|nr:PIN domain-containing protein [Deltaproteobacteria bacterium]
MKTSFRVVPDTNVVIASEKSTSKSSPNKEFFDRWRNDEFEILYSDDTLLEYIEKMRELNISEEIIKKLIRAMLELGKHISIIICLSIRLIRMISLFFFVQKTEMRLIS